MSLLLCQGGRRGREKIWKGEGSGKRRERKGEGRKLPGLQIYIRGERKEKALLCCVVDESELEV